jgi:hypothetical protein
LSHRDDSIFVSVSADEGGLFGLAGNFQALIGASPIAIKSPIEWTLWPRQEADAWRRIAWLRDMSV